MLTVGALGFVIGRPEVYFQTGRDLSGPLELSLNYTKVRFFRQI